MNKWQYTNLHEGETQARVDLALKRSAKREAEERARLHKKRGTYTGPGK